MSAGAPSLPTAPSLASLRSLQNSRQEFESKRVSYVKAKLLPALAGQNAVLSSQNFRTVLTTALDVEMATEEFELRRYDIAAVDVETVPPSRGGPNGPRSYGSNARRIKVEGLMEKRPSVVVGDFLKLFEVADESLIESRGLAFARSMLNSYGQFKVLAVEEEHVVFRVNPFYNNELPKQVRVEFMVNENEFLKQKAAVQRCCDKEVFLDADFCLDTNLRDRNQREVEHLEWSEGVVVDHHNMPLNAQQQRFVNVTLHHVNCPRVCLLWGPPGTGKTTTLSAMLRTLLDRRREKRRAVKVLFCTPSNFAADHLVELLWKGYESQRRGHELTCSRMLRIHAKSRLIKTVSDTVLKFSLPYHRDLDRPDEASEPYDFRYPELDELYAAEIIVATLSTAAGVFERVLKKQNLPLDYVIIDEAATATEAHLLNALQWCSKQTRVILAGDHCQLGPVVFCDQLKSNNVRFHVSAMERLLMNDRMQRQALVMLTVSYRCHPTILTFVNLFYGGRLESPKQLSDGQFTTSSGPSAYRRFQMLHVVGEESKGEKSPSVGNVTEALEVVDLLFRLGKDTKNLSAEQLRKVAVITPYVRQTALVRERLRSDARLQHLTSERREALKTIEIATIEAFQGREASIVIISTVRSGNITESELNKDKVQHLGFVGDKKRVNVALSRAIDHLFIVGNLRFIGRDPTWRKIIETGISMDPQAFVTRSGEKFVLDTANDAFR